MKVHYLQAIIDPWQPDPSDCAACRPRSKCQTSQPSLKCESGHFAGSLASSPVPKRNRSPDAAAR